MSDVEPIDAVLKVSGLVVSAAGEAGTSVEILHGVDLTVRRGSVLGIVGESGSGKTMLLRALLDLLPDGVTSDVKSSEFDGRDFAWNSSERLPFSMVFQDPLTAFNPLRRIGGHLLEVARRFRGLSRARARADVIDVLARVGVPDPERIYRQFPHELSGGLRQRALIAMALLANPVVLLADEPTTALDATIQAQILALLANLKNEQGLTTIIVTHDLSVVAALCDDVVVMKDGDVVETGRVDDVFAAPQHAYTRSLLDAVPDAGAGRSHD